MSSAPIYKMISGALEKNDIRGATVIDLGCGAGNLKPYLSDRFARYVGADAIYYEEFPKDAEFRYVDLDTSRVNLPDGCADAVIAVETIEHLENPRAFVRELVRLTKHMGWVIITTPNQLSLLSLLTLIVKRRFSAFQDVLYPAHLTALLEIDLIRIARECGLADIAIIYSQHGRLVLTPWHYPKFIARLFPRALSDNVLLIAKNVNY